MPHFSYKSYHIYKTYELMLKRPPGHNNHNNESNL